MTYYESIANIKGPQGYQGNGGQKGDPGLPGVNAVANDAAMAALVGNAGSATSAALFARSLSVVDTATLGTAASFTSAICGVVGDKMTIPTHVAPGGGEVTHPSVVVFPKEWNGYRYWMAMTPYAAADVAQEDPNVVASKDGITWVTPAGMVNPIQDAPGGADYNSDTELVVGPDGGLWLMWRRVTTLETFYLSKCYDGALWSTPVIILQTSITPLPRLLSPSLVREADHWTLWGVDMSTSPNTLTCRQSDTLDLTEPADWGTPVACTITGLIQNGLAANQEPWHVEVRRVGGQFVGLLTVGDDATSGNNAQIQAIVSANGYTWVGGTKSCIPLLNPNLHNRLYRATFVPEYVDGELVLRTWYSAVWMPPSGASQWNIFRTALRGSSSGGVIGAYYGEPVPAGTPPGRIVARSGYIGEVARNSVINPSPATTLTDWSMGGAGTGGAVTFTRETTGGPTAAAASWVKKIWTTASTSNAVYTGYGSNTLNACAVTAGVEWTFSAWLYAGFGGSVSSVRVLFYDAAGATLGGAEVLGAYYDHKAGTWQRRTLTCVTPAGAVRVAIRGWHQNAIPGVNAITGMTGLMAYPGRLTRDYFDGALSPDPKLTAQWVGTAYASQSVLVSTAPYSQYWDGITAISL